MSETRIRAHDDRRDSFRVLTRLMVRGLGEDRSWSDRLGDISMGGVGFEYPKAPDADRFQVAFTCPGETKLRRAVAEVVDYQPMPGTLDREKPFFVHLRFCNLADHDERALARALDRMIAL